MAFFISTTAEQFIAIVIVKVEPALKRLDILNAETSVLSSYEWFTGLPCMNLKGKQSQSGNAICRAHLVCSTLKVVETSMLNRPSLHKQQISLKIQIFVHHLG